MLDPCCIIHERALNFISYEVCFYSNSGHSVIKSWHSGSGKVQKNKIKNTFKMHFSIVETNELINIHTDGH